MPFFHRNLIDANPWQIFDLRPVDVNLYLPIEVPNNGIVVDVLFQIHIFNGAISCLSRYYSTSEWG